MTVSKPLSCPRGTASAWLAEVLDAHASPSERVWMAEQRAGVSANSLTRAFSAAGRYVNADLVALDAEQRHALEQLTYPGFTPSSMRDAARACLLLAYADVGRSSEVRSVVEKLYYKGDANEQIVVVRCLALLPEPQEYTLLATDAARSHVQPVFEALACSNPFPARYLPDAAFNQVVMKAFFTGVAVRRIAGLGDRNNQELRRMARDFASERAAAGRLIPHDLDCVTEGT